jgi:hypothetical protein
MLVYNFHRKTVQAASDIVGILGKTSFQDVNGNDIMRRVTPNEVKTLSEQFPLVESGCLLSCTAPPRLQRIWNDVDTVAEQKSIKCWIY